MSTPPAPGTTVHWTQFPAHALGTDWSDHRAAHRNVMRMFTENLPGGPGQVRAHNGILFRTDVIANMPTVLVQSQAAPMLIPAQARTMVLTGKTWDTQAGDHVRFRVAVNAIIRRERKESVLHTDLVPDWVADRLSPALCDVEVLNQYRDTYRQQRKGEGQKRRDELTVDIVDGVARVDDPATLERLRLDGVGRRKAYGAGLLTVQTIG